MSDIPKTERSYSRVRVLTSEVRARFIELTYELPGDPSRAVLDAWSDADARLAEFVRVLKVEEGAIARRLGRQALVSPSDIPREVPVEDAARLLDVRNEAELLACLLGRYGRRDPSEAVREAVRLLDRALDGVGG